MFGSQCLNCGKEYVTFAVLQRHLTYECGRSPTFSCPFCQKMFKRRDICESSFKCRRCGKIYASITVLKRHYNYECGKSPSVACPICYRLFKRRDNMKRHCFFTYMNHNKILECYFINKFLFLDSHIIYVCSDCGKRYKYKRNLNAHQRYECGKEPQLFCHVDGCNYVAKLKAHLKSHIRAKHKLFVTASKFKCDRCGKSYQHQASLWNHKKYTCGLGPQFCCPQCVFTTKYAHIIQQHVMGKHQLKLSRTQAMTLQRTNTKEEPYICRK
nr:unnamed protein product [Callosobruchus chinensis]